MSISASEIIASAEFKHVIEPTWHTTFQLDHLDMNQRNKDYHLLSILAGVDESLQPYLWDLLLSQAEIMTIYYTFNPKISAWEYSTVHG